MQFPTIAKAPRKEDEPLFLFCPEEGWHTGVWFEGRWVDALTLEEELYYAQRTTPRCSPIPRTEKARRAPGRQHGPSADVPPPS